MRATPIVRATTATMALTLALSSAVMAQTSEQTRFGNDMGATREYGLVLNSLDDAQVNARVERTMKAYIEDPLGGKTEPPAKRKKNAKRERVPGGLYAPETVEGRMDVTEATLELAAKSAPDLIIVSGGDWQSNIGIARSNPGTTFLDLNQPLACVTETSLPDTTGTCAGGEEAIPGNYAATEFAVEQGAYVAGVVAAREVRDRGLGIITGSLDCLECDRYVTGFVNGARSVNPGVEIEIAVLADDEIAGFSDPATAKTYAETFIEVYQPGVLMPVARGATMGMVEAACEAEIKVIGAGVDVSAERPDFRQNCVMASIVPDVSRAVEEALYFWSRGENPKVNTYDLARDGVTMTDEWRVSPTKRVDTNEFHDAARLAIETGQVEACPDGCGVFAPSPEAGEPAA